VKGGVVQGEKPSRSRRETQEARLKRLRMQSWRRGTREMDMILGPFADANLARMTASELDLYDQLLCENDQDLYQWVTGQVNSPVNLKASIARIAEFAAARSKSCE
jgi:antitoxin CptB